jgi:hypothetical protein
VPSALFVPLELPLSPTRVLAIGIEYARIVAVDRPHDADARQHRGSGPGCDEHQSFHGVLPFRRAMLGLGKLGDVVAGILQRDELAPAGQWYPLWGDFQYAHLRLESVDSCRRRARRHCRRSLARLSQHRSGHPFGSDAAMKTIPRAGHVVRSPVGRYSTSPDRK